MAGFGPVKAAVRVGVELTQPAVCNALPDLIVCLGSAGSRKLEQVTVDYVTSVLYRNMDSSAVELLEMQECYSSICRPPRNYH